MTISWLHNRLSICVGSQGFKSYETEVLNLDRTDLELSIDSSLILGDGASFLLDEDSKPAPNKFQFDNNGQMGAPQMES